MTTAKPFLKWAGGKQAILPELLKRLPNNINNYYEPCLGGGALFFALSAQGLINGDACLADSNAGLVMAYSAVMRYPTELFAHLQAYKENHSEANYAAAVKSLNKRTSLRNHNYYRSGYFSRCSKKRIVEIGALFIYLNKTCFNGLYRVNKSGQFNVPMGRYKQVAIPTLDNLLACSKALCGNVYLEVYDCCSGSLAWQRSPPGKDALCYFDPPYHQTEVKYTPNGFSEDDHIRLRDTALRLTEYDANVMISNSDTPFTRELYSDSRVFNIDTVQAPRNISCKGNGRGKVSELIVRNYR